MIQVYGGEIYVTQADYPKGGWDEVPDMYKCVSPVQQPVAAAIYWITYITIAALILLSLFVGIITMSMQESLDEMKRETEEVE